MPTYSAELDCREWPRRAKSRVYPCRHPCL